MNSDCEGSKFHSPRPRKVNSYNLPNKQIIRLCGTCHDNLNIYLALWEKENGLDWPTMRTFGNEIRRIGAQILEAKRTHHD